MPLKYLTIGDDMVVHYRHAGATTLPGVPPVFGRGALVVLLHGAGGSLGLFGGIFAALEPAHAPLALDLPGHGRSAGLVGPASVTEAAAVVGRLLAALAAPPAILVGHGLGGQVALRLALDRPGQARAVVTLGASAAPAAHAPSRAVIEREIGVLDQVVAGRLAQQFDMPVFGNVAGGDVMRAFWGEMVRTDPRVRAAGFRAQLGTDLRGELARVACPVRALRGSADRFCSAEENAEIACGVPRGRASEIEGAGHVAFLEQPGSIVTALSELIAEVAV